MAVGNNPVTSRMKLFWLLSGLATLLFVSITGFLMSVPGNDPRTDFLLPSMAALLLALALLSGTWRVQDAESPISVWPGPIAVVFLVIQLVIAVTQAIAEIRKL